MSMRREIAGEGASTPWFRSQDGPEPALVICPMLTAESCMDASMAQEIYRLAYERAQAALRPSAYDIAQKPSWN
jgi:hypothetical protein